MHNVFAHGRGDQNIKTKRVKSLLVGL